MKPMAPVMPSSLYESPFVFQRSSRLFAVPPRIFALKILQSLSDGMTPTGCRAPTRCSGFPKPIPGCAARADPDWLYTYNACEVALLAPEDAPRELA
jgi:hypothetical protein